MLRYFGKVLLTALIFFAGTIIGGRLAVAAGLPLPTLEGEIDMQLLGLLGLVAAIALTIGVAAIARRLAGGYWLRVLIVAWFIYAILGINNNIEASVFTTVGGEMATALIWLPASLMAGIVIAFLFRDSSAIHADARAFFADRETTQWSLRLVAAWLAFPLVYFLFGMPVGLIVGDSYREMSFGLQLPDLGTVLVVQLIRGAVFLLASLPIVMMWAAPNRRFTIVYGLGLFAVLGLHGLIQAYWLPTPMRVLHTIEILLGSLLYAWLLDRLLRESRLEARGSGLEHRVSQA